MQTTNITSLARSFKVSTKDIEKKLDKLGIKPVNEVLMPSGRRFVLYDKDISIKALEAAKEPPQAKPPVKKTTDLAAEIAEVKVLLHSLLEVVTRPQNDN